MSNILFVDNFYYTAKGHSYVVRDMVDALKSKNHIVHMLKIGLHPENKDFAIPDKVDSFGNVEVPEDIFRKKLEEFKPDHVIFMEYNQWFPLTHDKVAICKELGIKTSGFLVYEKLDWNKLDHYRNYTNIICPTGFQTKLLRRKGLYNSKHIPWGINFEEIDSLPEPERTDDIVRFYHCAGSGGVGNRKNTKAVIEAYKKIEDANTDLMVTHTGCKTFSHKEILSFTKYADVVINTSKWDTIGLNSCEANACGRPVLVANTEPMNEIVQDKVNGMTVEGDIVENPLGEKHVPVTCPIFEIDIDDLAKKMSICKNQDILKTLKGNARKFAEVNFDWKKNQKDFLKLFGEE
jgi:glycosyltransferase involved in cell wall biosynthesis